MQTLYISGIIVCVLLVAWVAAKKLKKQKALVTRLFVYPVKSCRGVPVKTLEFDGLGVKYDRRFMILDTVQGKMVTIRDRCRLSLVQPVLSEAGVSLISLEPKTAHLGAIFLPFMDDTKKEPLAVDVWGIAGTGEAVSVEADRWITNFIEADPSDIGPASIHNRESGPGTQDQQSDTTRANVPPRYRIVRLRGSRVPVTEEAAAKGEANARPSDKLAFQDGAQVMCANEASWGVMTNAVRARGSSPVYIEQMRPNIVVAGPKAWDEDNWGIVQGPKVLLRRQEPCQRCILTTVDTFTGKPDSQMNPLAWLRRERRPAQWYPKTKSLAKLGETPMFGMFFNVERRLSKLPDVLRRLVGGSASEQEIASRFSISLGDELAVTKRSYEPIL